MGRKFFECYCSHLRRSFDAHNEIDENDKLYTLNKAEFSEVFDETMKKTTPSHSVYLELLVESKVVELYEIVLYEIMHYVGSKETNEYQTCLTTFVQKVFKFDQKNHDAIYKATKEKDPPNFTLNIEIINGKIMTPKDSNSLRGLFCILYSSTNENCKYNTSTKWKTLEPVWEECFSLPIKNLDTDKLNLEVWYSNQIETVTEKVSKLNGVKGLKSAKIYAKKIITPTTYCKPTKERIGSTKISLNTIHFLSSETWYNVTYNKKSTGSVLMKLSLSTSKNKQVSVQEYINLLRILLLYQITEEKIGMYSWMGILLPESNSIIKQHVLQNNISSIDQYLGQWIEYINIHLLTPVINFKVFSDLIDKLVIPINSGYLPEDEFKMFWQSTKKMLPLWYNDIKMIRQIPTENEIVKIKDILNLFQYLQALNVPNDFDLFTPDIYDWLLPCENTRDIKCTLHDAIVQGALDWYKHILVNQPVQHYTEKEKMKRLLKVINLLKLDMQKALQFHDEMFEKKMQLPYSSIIFSIYGNKITDICEPFITEICKNMEPINFEASELIDDDPVMMGMALFELYIGIQEFTKLGNTSEKLHDNPLLKYHLWFKQGVIRWLEIATYKANIYIKKAVKLDKLEKIDLIVKYSSSVVDTLAIFNHIKLFWQQLAWPDPESSYSFITIIIDDICKCSLNYSNEMSNKVSHTIKRNKICEATNELCLTVNNINRIKYYISLFANGRSLMEMIGSLTHYKSDVENDCFKKKLQLMIKDAINTMDKTIENLLRKSYINKLISEIRNFLIECEKTVHDVNNTHLKSLIQYLTDSICTLHEELNEDNFLFILNIIIEQIVALIYERINENTKKKDPLPNFTSLRCSFHEIFNFLRNGNITNYNCKKIQELEILLNLHLLDTVDLIHEYYLTRLQEQNALKETNEGVLTVKLMFNNNVLKVEILNAHRLRPMDSNGFSDPFVTIYLLPQYKFTGIKSPKTAVKKKNLSPIFDASFKIPLTSEQRSLKNGMVMFQVQDEDLMGFRHEYISEAFVHFKDIPFTDMETDLDNLPQTKLFMSVPKTLDSKVLSVIKSRSTDRLATNFVRQLKSKIIESTRKYNK